MAELVTDEHPVMPRSVEVTVTEELMEKADDEPWNMWFSALPGAPSAPDDENQALRTALERRLVEACTEGYFPLGGTVQLRVDRDLIDTSVGRVVFNNYLPLDMQFINKDVAREELQEIARDCYDIYGQDATTEILDTLKSLGFRYATRSGLSICIDDTEIATKRPEIIEHTRQQVNRTNRAEEEGNIVEEERHSSVVKLWEEAREAIVDEIFDTIRDSFNSLWMMVNSGARANRSHISQIAGMRGLMSDPFGRLIEALPVTSNFHDGLNVLEYFVSTHGARKGLADTALRTADAGYLTRRLVDVAQAVMVSEDDCGTVEGISVGPLWEYDVYCTQCGRRDLHRDGVCHECGESLDVDESEELLESLASRIIGRVPAEDIVDPDSGEVIVPAGREIDRRLANRIDDADIVEVTIRSPLTCEARNGVCSKCYGRDMATQRPVELGTAVGIIAAQSIGEPGTQLTMRTFHTGSVAGEYITGVADVKQRKQQALKSLHEDVNSGRVSLEQAGSGRARKRAIKEMLKVLESGVHGLLRVVELFEARTPKGEAITSEVDGIVHEIQRVGFRRVIIHAVHSLDNVDVIRGERLAHDVYAADGETLLAEKGTKLLKKVRTKLRKAGKEDVTTEHSYLLPPRGKLYVREGSEVKAGDPLIAGPLEPEEILEKKGMRGVQEYLLREVQKVYIPHGVEINDKHIEVIIRQMLLRRKIMDHGDTRFLPGQTVDRFDFEAENERVREEGGREATARPQLLGITQASLATDSFLSAASFQRTTRVLSEAACEHKSDPLEGLKENVIIGRLIPAGSGMKQHREREISFAEGLELEMEGKREEESAEEALQRLISEFGAEGTT
ncbi:MAG: hypothetical protein ACLFWB_03570 [Armatimonadota bacterium]